MHGSRPRRGNLRNRILDIQVGDWVRTTGGRDVRIALLCDNGREVYVHAENGERNWRWASKLRFLA